MNEEMTPDKSIDLLDFTGHTVAQVSGFKDAIEWVEDFYQQQGITAVAYIKNPEERIIGVRDSGMEFRLSPRVYNPRS